MGAKESKNNIEEFQATNSSDEEEARVKERRKKSLAKLKRRQPKIHAQVKIMRLLGRSMIWLPGRPVEVADSSRPKLI